MKFLSFVRGFAASRESNWFTRSREAARILSSLGAALLIFGIVGLPAALADSNMPKAALADTQLPDPKQEAAAKALMESVRCLVCQGQSIADSDAELAADMRAMIRDRVQKGEKPEDIRRWLIARYGDWVSYKPVLDAATAPLWLAPLILISVGLWLARGRFRRRRT
ncbi:Cytochrome c-type biogenesis protein [Sphingomonas antarctica]